jgi:hypothetical protein
MRRRLESAKTSPPSTDYSAQQPKLTMTLDACLALKARQRFIAFVHTAVALRPGSTGSADTYGCL